MEHIVFWCIIFLIMGAVGIAAEKNRSRKGNRKHAEADRKHKELLDAVARLERRNEANAPAPLPTYESAERARVLALGRVRDGQHRHAILDAPRTSFANVLADQTATPSVIKSGVVDGVPYTLYSDGVVETDGPGGTLRFASLTDLVKNGPAAANAGAQVEAHQQARSPKKKSIGQKIGDTLPILVVSLPGVWLLALFLWHIPDWLPNVIDWFK
jgi:hypothetical protein